MRNLHQTITTLCFSVDLPLSAGHTFEYPNLQTAGEMGYSWASHQATDLTISGKWLAISSKGLFVYCMQQSLPLDTSYPTHFFNSSLKLPLCLAEALLTSF